MERRQFVQTLSGTARTFPWFSNLALHGAEAAKAPQRLVCIGLDFGLRPESFFPSIQGRPQSSAHVSVLTVPLAAGIMIRGAFFIHFGL